MTPHLSKRHRLSRAAKATAKITAWSGLAVFAGLALLAGTAWILYQNGTLDRWFESRWKKKFIAEQVARIQPYVPFKIEKVEIEASLKEIRAGRIRDLHVILSLHEWRGDFHGKLNVDSLFETTLKKQDVRLKIEYLPEVWMEWNGARTTPFSLSLKSEIDGNLKKGIQVPRDLSAVIAADIFKFSPVLGTGKPSAIEIKKLGMNIDLKNEQLHSSLHWDDLTLTHADIQAHTEAFTTALESDVIQKLKNHSDTIQFSFLMNPLKLTNPVQTIEILKGDDYFSLPWHQSWNLESTGTLSLKKTNANTIKNTPLQSLKLQIMHAKKKQLSVQILPDTLHARLKPTELKELLALLALQPARFFPEAIKEKLQIEKGELEIEADSHPHTLNQGNVKISFRDIAIRIPSAQFALKGMGVFAETSWNLAQTPEFKFEHADLAITRFGFRNLRGSLPFTTLRLNARKVNFTPRLNMIFESFPLRLGITEINLTEKGPELQTQMKLDPISLEQVNQLFCLGMKRPAPVTVFGDLKKITLNSEVFAPEGTLEAKLFNGWARVENIAVYDPTTAVPEINFDLFWGGLKLSSMADWLGFGEMNGVIEGQSKDTVFQAWLPTHYDFSVAVKADRYKDVVFSPEAMKNFVRLFAADALEQLPGIVNWAVWGWPSRLLGGFDVDYAGFSLFADEGSILLETHDPPKILEKENGKHFFLYGSRFKMPLTGFVYPRVLDAPALAILTHRIKKQLDAIAENKKKKSVPNTSQSNDQNQGMEPSKNAYENSNSEPTNCQPQL